MALLQLARVAPALLLLAPPLLLLLLLLLLLALQAVPSPPLEPRLSDSSGRLTAGGC